MELRHELDKMKQRAVGGVFPIGGRRCLSLQELEEYVPAKILLQCYSCLTLHKPSLSHLVRSYGKVEWGTKKQHASSSSESTKPVDKKVASAPKGTRSKTADNGLTKTRKKRRLGTHEMVSAGRGGGGGGGSLGPPNPESKQKSSKKTINSSTSASSSTSSSLEMFSTIQILRSLAVCLKTMPAKKAALQWAEQQLQADNNGTDRHRRLLGQWKKHYQELELKATVATRKKERAKVSKQKRKNQINARKKRDKLFFQQGQTIEKELLEKNFDMTSRVVFNGGGSSRNDDDNVFLTQLDDDDDDDDDMTVNPSLMYPDDFEDEENEEDENDDDMDGAEGREDWRVDEMKGFVKVAKKVIFIRRFVAARTYGADSDDEEEEFHEIACEELIVDRVAYLLDPESKKVYAFESPNDFLGKYDGSNVKIDFDAADSDEEDDEYE